MDLTPSVAELPEHVQRGLAKSFIEDAVIGQYRQLVRWQHITGQSAQIDSGYLGQHLVSLVSGKAGRGRGSRGKGADLDDGSEIKIASTLGGVDKPRWNNKLSTPHAVATYLGNPAIYFGLFDTLEKGEDFPVRVRVWIVEPPTDAVFCNVVKTWADKQTSGNFQLHPPCWSDSNVATNNSGNLELPLAFLAVQLDIEGVDYLEVEHWDPNPGACTPAGPQLRVRQQQAAHGRLNQAHRTMGGR